VLGGFFLRLEGGLVGPWQPALRLTPDLVGMALNHDRIVEGVDFGLVGRGDHGGEHEADLISRVKSTIAERLASGTPNEEVIAKAVFTNSRTLIRRLAEKGTNFRKLLAEVRQELAKQYVADPSIPITEISFILGFSDVSAFSRAFKRWTGEAPQAFRGGASR
jgi:AraC-like DNA-binding protein